MGGISQCVITTANDSRSHLKAQLRHDRTVAAPPFMCRLFILLTLILFCSCMYGWCECVLNRKFSVDIANKLVVLTCKKAIWVDFLPAAISGFMVTHTWATRNCNAQIDSSLSIGSAFFRCLFSSVWNVDEFKSDRRDDCSLVSAREWDLEAKREGGRQTLREKRRRRRREKIRSNGNEKRVINLIQIAIAWLPVWLPCRKWHF